MIDQVHLAHLRRASLVQGKPRRAATTPRPTGTSGPTPSRTARRPTTGCRSSAARPGSGTRAAAILPAQFPGRAARPQLPQPRGAGRAARRHPLLAGARRRRLPPRHDQLLLPLGQGCEDNPALPPKRAQRLDRAGGQSLQLPGPSLRQEPAGESRLPATASAPCSTNIRRSPRSARSATRSAGWRSWPPTRPAATACRCAIPSISSAPEKTVGRQGPLGARNLRQGRQRRLVVLGASPTTTWCATPSRWGDGERRPDRLSQGRSRRC